MPMHGPVLTGAECVWLQHAFAHETVRRLTAAGAEPMGAVWSEFVGSSRWRPPHYQVACEFVSEPSEFLFEEGGRGDRSAQ